MPAIQVLTLDSNQLTSLPTDIGQLARLEKLSVKNNAISTLPISISQLQKLSVLDLSSNRLVELTHAVANCYQLEELDVGKNDLQVNHFVFRWPFLLSSVSRSTSVALCALLFKYVSRGCRLLCCICIGQSRSLLPHYIFAGNAINLAAATENQNSEFPTQQHHKCTVWDPD